MQSSLAISSSSRNISMHWTHNIVNGSLGEGVTDGVGSRLSKTMLLAMMDGSLYENMAIEYDNN